MSNIWNSEKLGTSSFGLIFRLKGKEDKIEVNRERIPSILMTLQKQDRLERTNFPK